MKHSKLQTIAALTVFSMYGSGFAIDIGNPAFTSESKKIVYGTKAKLPASKNIKNKI